MTAISHRTNGQTFISRASDLPTRAERDVWGHWGFYHGPMVGIP